MIGPPSSHTGETSWLDDSSMQRSHHCLSAAGTCRSSLLLYATLRFRNRPRQSRVHSPLPPPRPTPIEVSDGPVQRPAPGPEVSRHKHFHFHGGRTRPAPETAPADLAPSVRPALVWSGPVGGGSGSGRVRNPAGRAATGAGDLRPGRSMGFR